MSIGSGRAGACVSEPGPLIEDFPTDRDDCFQAWPLPKACTSEVGSPGRERETPQRRKFRVAALEALGAHDVEKSPRSDDEADSPRCETFALRRLFARVARLEVRNAKAVADMGLLQETYLDVMGRIIDGQCRRSEAMDRVILFQRWRRRASTQIIERAKEQSVALQANGYDPRQVMARKMAELIGDGTKSNHATMTTCLSVMHLWQILASAANENNVLADRAIGWAVGKWTCTVWLSRFLRFWRAYVAQQRHPEISISEKVSETLKELDASLADVFAEIQDSRNRLLVQEEENERLRACLQKVGLECAQFAELPEGSGGLGSPSDGGQGCLDIAHRQERLLDELHSSACALANAIHVHDDAMELQRVLKERALLWRRLQGGLRPSLEKERAQAQRAAEAAAEDCVVLEANVHSLLQKLSRVAKEKQTLEDDWLTSSVLAKVSKVQEDMEKATTEESQIKAWFHKSIRDSEAECAKLRTEINAQRDCARMDADRISFVGKSEIEAERESQWLLQQQLREERDRVMALESEHATLLQEGMHKLRYSAEVGAVACHLGCLTHNCNETVDSRFVEPSFNSNVIQRPSVAVSRSMGEAVSDQPLLSYCS